jgi:hypothetical protein
MRDFTTGVNPFGALGPETQRNRQTVADPEAASCTARGNGGSQAALLTRSIGDFTVLANKGNWQVTEHWERPTVIGFCLAKALGNGDEHDHEE